MGTSTSSRGPNNRSPLVPPWADTDGKGPGPEPLPQRFRGFRTSLGRFVANGDATHLRNALRSYASDSTGGAEVGPRRFGAMVQAGGQLFDVLNQLRSDPANAPVNLRDLAGKSTRQVINAIVDFLVPENGDADRIRVGLNEALAQCLEGEAEFNTDIITDEFLLELMVAYVSQCVFEQVVLDSDRAFAKASTPERVEAAENELLVLVGAATEKHMLPLLKNKLHALSIQDVEGCQMSAIKEVWLEWEKYHD